MVYFVYIASFTKSPLDPFAFILILTLGDTGLMKTKQDFEILLNFYTNSNEMHDNQFGNFRISRERKKMILYRKKVFLCCITRQVCERLWQGFWWDLLILQHISAPLHHMTFLKLALTYKYKSTQNKIRFIHLLTAGHLFIIWKI